MLEIVRWLETELFNDWSVAHQFEHVRPLGELHLTLETLTGGRVSHSLRSFRTDCGELQVALQASFQQFPELVWFYGGWIDQAVFTLRYVRSGQIDLLGEVAPLLDSDPIGQAGDAVLGCCDWQHQLLFLAEVSREAASLKISLRTDSPDINKALKRRSDDQKNVA